MNTDANPTRLFDLSLSFEVCVVTLLWSIRVHVGDRIDVFSVQ